MVEREQRGRCEATCQRDQSQGERRRELRGERTNASARREVCGLVVRGGREGSATVADVVDDQNRCGPATLLLPARPALGPSIADSPPGVRAGRRELSGLTAARRVRVASICLRRRALRRRRRSHTEPQHTPMASSSAACARSHRKIGQRRSPSGAPRQSFCAAGAFTYGQANRQAVFICPCAVVVGPSRLSVSCQVPNIAPAGSNTLRASHLLSDAVWYSINYSMRVLVYPKLVLYKLCPAHAGCSPA